MSNTEQKIEELRQKLNELEQQWEREQADVLISNPFKEAVRGGVTEGSTGCSVVWEMFSNNRVDPHGLFKTVKKIIQLESWVLSNM